MKKYLFILCAALSGSALFAQSRIIDIHPAASPEGKMLTMEDVITNRNIYPENLYCTWKDSGSFRYYKNGKWEEKTVVEVPSEQEKWSALNRGNSLYITKGADTLEVAFSNNSEIVYGQSVSRNEFGINEGVYFSPSGNKLAFFRKDESLVTDFPLIDITTRTGTLREIKYPMNGMDSERISLGVYNIASKSTVYIDVTDFGKDRYLTNISWSPDDKYVFIQVLDRTQHHMRLNQYNSTTGEYIKTILAEDNEKWVEPLDHIHFLEGRKDVFIYRTDNRDGYKNLYLVDTLGTVRRLTAVPADVEYVGNKSTKKGWTIFYTSAEVSPIENHLFSVDIKAQKKLNINKLKFAKPVNLTPERGWHDIAMAPGCDRFIDSWSNLNVPRIIKLRSTVGEVEETLLEASDPLEGYAGCEVNLGSVKSADGKFDNYFRLIKPLGFDPSKKYPVIVYVYGGPHSQMVQDAWLGEIRMWEMLMAQKGYLVYVQDNRGTQNRGAEFEKAINRQCGQAEMADQMEGIKMLKSLPYVDADRIGVHGWSYGGFMTISLMTNYPETFKVGVAGGPVIDWKWYEIMYGERYMDTEETNPEGFAKTSLINKAKDLKGKLLICQGAIDNTVVWEHSLSFVRECVKNNVQLDYFPYPCHEHNVRGKDRVHLMDKVTMYFEDYL